MRCPSWVTKIFDLAPRESSVNRLAVINESKRVTDSQVDVIVAAAKLQMRDYCRQAGLLVPSIARYRGAPTGSIPVVIVDNPDVAGALGYHDELANGQQYSRIFVDPILDNGGSIFGDRGDPSLSVSGCTTHEIPEWDADPACNRWADTATPGVQIALEASDPVQNHAYFVTVKGQRVAVSNLVLPAWFDPYNTVGPWDLMHVLDGPFKINNGYWIERDFRGSEVEKFGKAVVRQVQFVGGNPRAMAAPRINPARGTRTAIRLQEA